MTFAYFAICILLAMFAKSRGRSGFLWFLGSVFVSPVVAFIVLVLLEIF